MVSLEAWKTKLRDMSKWHLLMDGKRIKELTFLVDDLSEEQKQNVILEQAEKHAISDKGVKLRLCRVTTKEDYAPGGRRAKGVRAR